MLFLKITDPTKRDQTVKEYLELKKNIRDNLLSERTREQQLQTELTKFYRPITESQKATTKEITESQKATAREITEGLRPIREGIENLQPIGEASAKAPEEEEEDELVGYIAIKYLRLDDKVRDRTFGINKIYGHHHIGDTHVIIHKNNIIIDNEKFMGTPGLWDLIMLKEPKKSYSDKEYKSYIKILLKTHVLYQDNNPNNPYPKSSKSYKWNRFLKPIWENRRLDIEEIDIEGKGVIILSSDPNALLERLDLLIASQKAGHMGVGNELVSICDELKRQGVLDTDTYKKINSIIKNDST